MPAHSVRIAPGSMTITSAETLHLDAQAVAQTFDDFAEHAPRRGRTPSRRGAALEDFCAM